MAETPQTPPGGAADQTNPPRLNVLSQYVKDLSFESPRAPRSLQPGERRRLEVEDEGPGIAREIRARLFTPHATTKANGSGMGLFLAQRLAGHRYHGSVRLDDRDGQGTIARLELGPRQQSRTEAG